MKKKIIKLKNVNIFIEMLIKKLSRELIFMKSQILKMIFQKSFVNDMI